MPLKTWSTLSQLCGLTFQYEECSVYLGTRDDVISDKRISF